MANIRKPVTATGENKVRTNPFERRDRLAFKADPKYYAQWFNDVGTTIMDMQEAGFTFVSEKERWGYENQGNPDSGTNLSDRVAINVGRAGGQENVTAYLMRMPIDDFNEMMEPMREEARRNRALEEINKLKSDGYYGDMKTG